MSNRIILGKETIGRLEDAGELCIFKYTSKNMFNSYFFGPNISIKLKTAKVSWMDANSISFQFEKFTTESSSKLNLDDVSNNLDLLSLLRDVNSKLVELYLGFKESRGHVNIRARPCIFYEKDNFFYIKCNLPKVNGRYLISCDDGGVFFKPRIGCVYNYVILDIRNIWEIIGQEKVGFRLELKVVSN
jgi:hypothetical protein